MRLGLLRRPAVFAVVLGVLLVIGTVAGGALYESINPSYDRVVWLEHDAADAAAPVAVRRALFGDGRFLALSDDGYRAGVLDQRTTDEIFAAIRAGASDWNVGYDAAGVTGERIELVLGGPTTKQVAVANPEMNLRVPADLERVLRLLSSADRVVASVPFIAGSLVFSATPLQGGSDSADGLPMGFPLDAAKAPQGVAIGGADLAVVKAMWTDLDSRLEPSLAHRVVIADGRAWQISWRLDLDDVGRLPASAVGP